MTDLPAHVARAAAHLGYDVDRLLPGGWQQGAWVVRRGADTAVLKVHTDELVRVEEAWARVERGVAAGWPTPRWRDVGRLADAVYVLMDYVGGARPAAMTDRVVDAFVSAFEIQRGLGDERPAAWGTWGRWVDDVVFHDGPGLRGRIRGVFPRADEIIAHVDAIASVAAGIRIHDDDLVHGNCNIANIVDAGDALWLVDVSSLGSGPVEYDAAETVLVAADQDAERLWRWIETNADLNTFAVCVASDALSMADAFARLGYLHQADARVPSLLRNLERARRLIG